MSHCWLFIKLWTPLEAHLSGNMVQRDLLCVTCCATTAFTWQASATCYFCIWVRSRNWGCFVTWFCYQLIAKPGNKTASVPWPDPYILCISGSTKETAQNSLELHIKTKDKAMPGLCSSGTLASMMTSSNRNIFHITGLCEGISPVTGEFPSQRPVTWSFDFFFDLHWTNSSANYQYASDLRHHHAHYNDTVMFGQAWLLCKCSCCIPIFSFCHMSVSTFHEVMQHAVSCHIGPCYNETWM